MDGEHLGPLLELPEDIERAKGREGGSTIDVAKLNFPGCSQLYVLKLGRYQLEVLPHQPSEYIVLPKLAYVEQEGISVWRMYLN